MTSWAASRTERSRSKVRIPPEVVRTGPVPYPEPSRHRRLLFTIEDEIEPGRRHHGPEVVLLGVGPAGFPVGPVLLAFAFEQALPPDIARGVEKHTQIEDIVELGRTSRMTMRPFHFGSSNSSQVFGASSAVIFFALYMITSGVRKVATHAPLSLFASAGRFFTQTGA